MEQNKEFLEMIQRLKEHFHPTKIFVFGSRANGTARENSDYDLLLLVPTADLSVFERMQEAQHHLFRCRVWIPADIFIYTEKEYAELKDIPGTLAKVVATQGRELNVA